MFLWVYCCIGKSFLQRKMKRSLLIIKGWLKVFLSRSKKDTSGSDLFSRVNSGRKISWYTFSNSPPSLKTDRSYMNQNILLNFLPWIRSFYSPSSSICPHSKKKIFAIKGDGSDSIGIPITSWNTFGQNFKKQLSKTYFIAFLKWTKSDSDYLSWKPILHKTYLHICTYANFHQKQN